MPKGQRPRVPDCDCAGTAERSYPVSEVRGAAERRYPMPLSPRLGAADGRSYTMPPRPKTRASSQEKQPKTKARGSDKRDYPELWLCGHRRA